MTWSRVYVWKNAIFFPIITFIYLILQHICTLYAASDCVTSDNHDAYKHIHASSVIAQIQIGWSCVCMCVCLQHTVVNNNVIRAHSRPFSFQTILSGLLDVAVSHIHIAKFFSFSLSRFIQNVVSLFRTSSVEEYCNCFWYGGSRDKFWILSIGNVLYSDDKTSGKIRLAQKIECNEFQKISRLFNVCVSSPCDGIMMNLLHDVR